MKAWTRISVSLVWAGSLAVGAFCAESKLPAPTLKRIQGHALAFGGILSTVNQEPLDELATGDSQSVENRRLAQWWDVSDRTEFLALLDGLIAGTHGHRAPFHRMLQHYLDVGMPRALETMGKEAKTEDGAERILVVVSYLHAPPLPNGVMRFTAWDFGRYINLCRWGYGAGYISESEAWARILPVARLLQRSFPSWDAFAKDYIAGREFYSLGAMRDGGAEVLDAYHGLTEPTAGCWAKIPGARRSEMGLPRKIYTSKSIRMLRMLPRPRLCRNTTNMGAARHMCQSVRGPLRNWSGRQWNDATTWMRKDDGSAFASGEELEHHFQQLLESGVEVIPIGDCDNFDPKTGCCGHPIAEPKDGAPVAF